MLHSCHADFNVVDWVFCKSGRTTNVHSALGSALGVAGAVYRAPHGCCDLLCDDQLVAGTMLYLCRAVLGDVGCIPYRVCDEGALHLDDLSSLGFRLPAHCDPFSVEECPGQGIKHSNRTIDILVSTIVLASSAREGSVWAAVS